MRIYKCPEIYIHIYLFFILSREMLRVLLFVLIAVLQRIQKWIMEKALVAVAPRKTFVTLPQILVRHELGPMRMLGANDKRVDRHERNHWNAHE